MGYNIQTPKFPNCSFKKKSYVDEKTKSQALFKRENNFSKFLKCPLRKPQAHINDGSWNEYLVETYR